MLSKKIIRNVKYLKNTAALLFNDKPEYRSHANDVISKYENGKIQRLDSALNLITKLARARGMGKQKVISDVKTVGEPKPIKNKTTISKVVKKKTNNKSLLDVGINDDDGVIYSKSTIKSKDNNQAKLNKYFMTADVNVEILFTSNVQDDDTLKDHIFKSVSKEIHAASEVEAKVKYADEVHQDYVDSKMYERGDTKILNIHYTSIVNASE